MDAYQASLNKQLLQAVSELREGQVAQLLGEGADANMQDDNGSPVLVLACWSIAWRCAEALLDHGADINATDRAGCSPVLAATDRIVRHELRHYGDEIERLVDRGADLAQPSDTGQNAADLIRECHPLFHRRLVDRARVSKEVRKLEDSTPVARGQRVTPRL